MSRRTAEMVLKLVDRATRPARQFMNLQRRMGRAVEASNQVAERSARNADRAASRTERTLSKLGRTARSSFRVLANAAKKAGQAVMGLHEQTLKLGKFGIGQIGSGWARARGGLMAGAAAVTIAYGSAAAAAGGLIGTASEFERFQTILMTTEGSAEAAREAMGWVSSFAVKTPYELDQVTDAFVSLRAYGLDPTNGLLETLGDTSAAMGKPLSQAVEAIADAVTGENERLKEFGIKASKTGRKIVYEYTNAAGKSMRVSAAASDRMAIQQTLMAIMNEKYAGSMQRLSQTWGGMTSNLSDLWTKFMMMIMNAGLFDWMKDRLAEILETINRMEADGTLLQWATRIGQTIQSALADIWAFGKGVWDVIQQVVGYLSTAADYVGGWRNLAMVLGGIAFAPTLISTAVGLMQIAAGLAALSGALMANPIMLTIAAIAGGAYLIYRNWDALGPYFQGLWDGIVAKFSAAWEALTALFDQSPVETFKAAWTGITAVVLGVADAIADFWGGVAASVAGWATTISGHLDSVKSAFSVLGETLGRIFGALAGNQSIAKFGNLIGTVLAGGFTLFLRALTLIAKGLNAFLTGLEAAALWIGANWGPVAEALAGPIEAGKAAIDVVWRGIQALFNWSPVEFISSTWNGIATALSSPIETGKSLAAAAWEGLKAIFAWTPLGLITGNWGAISKALSSPIETGRDLAIAAWEGIKTLFSWSPLAVISQNWDGIGAVLASPINAGIALVQAAWDGLKLIFSWVPSIDTTALSAGMEAMTGIVQRGWEMLSGIFDSIVNGATLVGEKVGGAISAAVSGAQAALSAIGGDKGVERIFGQLDAMAERGYSADFVQGQALTEGLAAGELSLEAYRRSLEAVAIEGGAFAQTAREMVEASRQLDSFKLPEAVALPQPQETEATMARLAEIEATANRVPGIVRDAIAAVQATLAAVDFSAHGSRMMQALADGIRSKVAEVTAAAQMITQALRSALPSSAAINVGVQGAVGAKAPVQKRASGGAFGPGWLLTGEQGPELEYRSQGGFVAHNRALQDMVAMSQIAARNVANTNRSPGWLKGAAVASSIAASASALPAAAFAPNGDGSGVSGEKYITTRNQGGGATTISMPLTLNVHGNVDASVMPDLKAELAELETRIMRKLESNARAKRRQEH